jgi:hypothetical protein
MRVLIGQEFTTKELNPQRVFQVMKKSSLHNVIHAYYLLSSDSPPTIIYTLH